MVEMRVRYLAEWIQGEGWCPATAVNELAKMYKGRVEQHGARGKAEHLA